MDTICDEILEAARRGDSDRVVVLARSNPFIPNSTAIEPALLTACEFGQLSVVRSCIDELRCNPNCVDKSGRSPLHMSVTRKENGKVAVSIIKFLVSRGAKLRKSVLHVCNNELTIFPLIDLGADLNAKSVDGLCPIAVAISNDRQEVVTELIRGKCEIESGLIFKAKSLHVVQELVRAGVDVNTRDKYGRTALQYAVESNDKRLARALLECKADPNLVTLSCSSSQDEIHTRTNSAQVSRSNSVVMKSGKISSMNDAFEKLTELRAFVKDSLMSETMESMMSTDPTEWDSFHGTLIEMSNQVVTIQKRCLTFKKEASAASLCVVCRSSPKSVVLLPCKHMCCCQVCSRALFRGTWDDGTNQNLSRPACPICRSAVMDSVSVFT
jgi:ankyrin repeat protein